MWCTSIYITQCTIYNRNGVWKYTSYIESLNIQYTRCPEIYILHGILKFTRFRLYSKPSIHDGLYEHRSAIELLGAVHKLCQRPKGGTRQAQ